MVCEKYNLHKPVSNQPQYNILRTQIETNGVLDVSVRHGMGQVVWSPLAQGMLTGKYSGGNVPEGSRAAHDRMSAFLKKENFDMNVLAQVDRFKELALEMGVTAAQLALAWCLRIGGVTTAITSASRPEQVVENCGAVNIEYTPELENRIKEIFA